MLERKLELLHFSPFESMSTSAVTPDMGVAALSALMAEDGPIVNVVILHTDGSVSEKSVDMSPKAYTVSAVLASLRSQQFETSIHLGFWLPAFQFAWRTFYVLFFSDC